MCKQIFLRHIIYYSISCVRFFVQAAVVTYNPGETLDPTDPSCQADNNCYVVIPGATIGSSVFGGTPNQVLYTDADGKVFGDSQFTRDSTTGNTNIGVANGVVASSMSILNTGNTLTWDANTNDSILDGLMQGNNLNGVGYKGNALAHYDTSTYESAAFFAGDTTAVGGNPYEASMTYVLPGGINGVFTYTVNDDGLKAEYYDIVGNIKSQTLQEATGNTISWDADTTDDVTAKLSQSDDIFGIGIKGNLNLYQDTNTNQKAFSIVGDGTSVGVPGYFVISEVADTTGQLHAKQVLVADDAAGINTTYYNEATDTSVLQVFNGSGSKLTWDADTTDTITTKLEQNQNLAGLGASGSALTWSDSATQVTGLVGAIDATAVGLFPGSVLIATNNLGTGASASLATNYDDVLNVATIVANAGNGDFDSGFEFDDGRMVVQYRNNVVGLESSFEADANSAVTRYTADGTNEYQAVLGNGIFTLKNSTTGNEYMAIDLASGVYEIGDLDASGNDTKLIINDTTGLTTARSDGGFEVINTGGNVAFTASGGGGNFFVKLGDADNVANQTSLTVDDANQAITFGYTGSSYTFPIGDGTSNYLLATDGLGQIFWQDPTMVPSDRSLKSNVNELSYGLDTLMQLNPVSYTMNSTGKEQIGFIAQEVESLVPELVGEVANGKKGLAYGQMTAVIVKSIQEMNLKISDIDTQATAMIANKTFTDGLVAWLGDAANGIGDLFASRINTHELCVDGQCLNQDDVRALLELVNQTNSGGNSDGATIPVPDPEPGLETVPVPSDEPAVDPEITDISVDEIPEPVVTPDSVLPTDPVPAV